MINFIVFVIILSVLVLVHEFGHFIAAKRFGVKVEEFALGFPPKIWSKQKGETNYQINAIPFGGYVKLFGEDGQNESSGNSFAAKKWWQRFIIIISGIVMNLVLGSVILMIAFMIGLPVMSQQPEKDYPYAQINSQTIVYKVNDDSNFKNVLQDGDQIISLNGASVLSVQDFKDKMQNNNSDIANMIVKRQNQEMPVTGKIKVGEDGKMQIGVLLGEGQTIQYPFYMAIPMGIVEMFRLLWAMILALFLLVKQLIFDHRTPTEIAGPVGIYKIASIAREMGLVYLLQLTALLNINLAIINVLPLPALDGGRLLFIVIEKIRGQKISANFENLVHTAGFVVLIGLIILVTISDVRKLF